MENPMGLPQWLGKPLTRFTKLPTDVYKRQDHHHAPFRQYPTSCVLSRLSQQHAHTTPDTDAETIKTFIGEEIDMERKQWIRMESQFINRRILITKPERCV